MSQLSAAAGSDEDGSIADRESGLSRTFQKPAFPHI